MPSLKSQGPAYFRFIGELAFLSNFWIEPDGSHVEGEYQRAKAAIASQRALFHSGKGHEGPLLPPSACKALGQTVELRPDWEDVKVRIMEFYVRKKFRDHHSLALSLKATTPNLLFHQNTHGDTFWGIVGDKGLNVLGEILMQVREEL